MKNELNNWVDYWDVESIVSDTNWKTHTDIFLKATDPILNYSDQDTMLDIGCGAGHLAADLKDRVKEICCLDTSQRFLDLCRQRLGHNPNVSFHRLDPAHYTDLSCLNGKKFSIVVCLSVIQYYQSVKEVERLISEVRRVALPGARFLIADIPTQPGMVSDLYRMLIGAVRKRCFLKTLKLLCKTQFSPYRRTRSSLGLLTLSSQCLHGMIDRLGLDAKLLSTHMTLNESRRHLLITF